MEEECKDLKNLESKRLQELRTQLQDKQLEAERAWSELTNTWAVEKITKDSKIDELKRALEEAREQQLASKQLWKTAIEEEKSEKLAQVNRLIERVKGMEVKQHEIRQDMEKKLRNIQEQAREKYQKSVKQMQEEYQMKLEQEVQRHTSRGFDRERIGSSLAVRETEDKMSSQKRALETAKQKLHQGKVETESPEMDCDYYGVHGQTEERLLPNKGDHNPGRIMDEAKEVPKRAASTPLDEGSNPQSYGTFGLSAVEKSYTCENCQKRHEPPLCGCPNCGGPHLISRCPFSGTPKGDAMPKTGYTEPWSKCIVCHLCHQGTCPCAKCGELADIATDCLVAGMEDWSKVPSTKRSCRDQVFPEKRGQLHTLTIHMWCGKCGISHPQNEPCRYPDVSKALWCPNCGGQQNDHVKGCPVEKERQSCKSVRNGRGRVILKKTVPSLGFPVISVVKWDIWQGNVLRWEDLL